MGADSRTQTAIPPVDFHSSWPLVMNKRSFIKLFSGMLAGPAVSPLLALLPDSKLKNWAGNVEYGTENLYTVNSLEQARDFVRKQSRLKVLGTRHCFNKIADSTNQFLSLKPADELVAINSEARTATVDGSMTYGHLCPLLHEKGFALHNLASLPHISIAGSCSTGTHGSGDKNGNLATAVSALEMITASSDPIQLSRQKDGDKFSGAVVGLGALGVITKVTLGIQPAYTMKQYVYLDMPLDQVMEYFVPRRHAVEAILAVERLHEQVSPHLLITEIRTIAADDLWMSPCYKQPSVTIHFTWKQDWPAVRKLLPIIEKELLPFKPRPHWGKLFTIPPAELKSAYEKLPEFIELSKTYDPSGKFRNPFLNTNIFGDRA